jgi:hypothetical protein
MINLDAVRGLVRSMFQDRPITDELIKEVQAQVDEMLPFQVASVSADQLGAYLTFDAKSRGYRTDTTRITVRL